MKWWLLPSDIHDWNPPTWMVLGTVTQKFGKISWLGATAYAMSGVSNCMPSAASGAARSVAPTGPVVMPGAVGMPLSVAAVEPPSSPVLPEPEELPELDDAVPPPELPPLLPPVVDPP